MSDRVILIVADANYLPHAKALMVNCVRQGGWRDDFRLMCPSDCDTSSVEGRGIEIMRTTDNRWLNTVKFRMFSPDFQRWKRVLYLDCDIIIQGDLRRVFDLSEPKLPSILFDGPQENSILADWEHFDALSGVGPEAHPEVYERMRERFPHIDKPVYVSSAVFFAPENIPAGTVEELFAAQAEFQEANPGGHDQQVMNLVLYDRMASLGKDCCTWFAFDYPENRVPSEARGWRGDEEPVILHFWGMYAPWLIKQEGAGGHLCHRLNRVVHELYQENLAAFDETFPIK